MKSFFRGATALAGIALAGSAFAADLPRRAAPPIFVPVPVFTWTGFYAGFNAGYAFDVGSQGSNTYRNRYNALVLGGTPPTTITYSNQSNEGFSGGGQIGYNYQFTPGSGVVVGIEADAQYLDFGKNRNSATFSSGTPNPNVTFVDPRGLSSLDYFGTVRGRLGYAFDRTLVYGTGGFAYGGGGGRDFGLPNGTQDDFRTGYAAGGGIEYALPTDSFFNFFKSSAVTLKVEGLYVNLDRGNKNAGVYAFNNNTNALYRLPGFSSKASDEFAVVRAGLNYKFGTY